MTGQFGDFANSDVILTCGGNPAECHPASMKWINRAIDKGATYIVVDPRFTRSAARADIYCPIRPGTDIAFFGGMINYIFENDRMQRDYCVAYTNISYLVDPDYQYDADSGLFSGFNSDSCSYDKTTWAYQIEEEKQWDTSDGGAYAWTRESGVPAFNTPTLKVPKKDETLQDPNCVYQIMREHYSRYTLDTVSSICGMDKDVLEHVYDVYTATGASDKAGAITYALGQTQHSVGTGNTRIMSIVQLLLGNIGVPGGQLGALRGEPNVQGCTDLCIAPGDMPGYLQWPTDTKDRTLAEYLENETATDGYWSNKPKFLISWLKSFFGENATADNDYGYDWLPKLDSAPKRSIQNAFHLMEEGVIKGYWFFGQNPLQSLGNSKYLRNVIANLDWLVFDDMYMTETASFWDAPDMRDKASEINTECYFLPIASLFEKNGTVINSGRVMQWRYQAIEPRGDSKWDLEAIWLVHQRLRKLYEEEGGALPDPILNAKWDYAGDDGKPDMRKVAWELNGYSTYGATEDFENGTPKLLDGYSKLKADGSTASGVWIYTGYYGNPDAPFDPAQQNVGRRLRDDPDGLNIFPKWAFSWPANRRILYNRASCDMDGKPWREGLAPVEWDGEKWVTNDVPDFVASKTDSDGNTVAVEPNNKAFFMNWEQNARLFASTLNDMPLPEHYEPFESPTENLLNGAGSNPAMLFNSYDSNKKGASGTYPIVATTYSFTEHWSSGAETHNAPVLNEMMPTQYCELPTELAQEKGIENGDDVRIFNDRGSIVVKAMVTKRITPLTVNGSKQYTIGIVHDWGWANVYTHGDITNDLVPGVGDPNSFIAENKAFLVDIEKA
jgi:formate dehydrogenase major subunit